MQKYLYRRILLFFPTLLMGSFIIFAIMRILPGDIAIVILGGEEEVITPEALENLRIQLGLYDPLWMQYTKWIWSMVNGSFGGHSLVDSEPIRNIIALRMPVTAQLAIMTVALSVVVAIPTGVIAAVKQDKWPDYLIRIILVGGLSVPSFWAGLLILLFLLLTFRWVPPIIFQDLWENPIDNMAVMIWPILVMAWHFAAYIARVTRSNILEVMRMDYIRTAHSKGLKQNTVLWRHALKNALIPVITVAGVYLGTLMGGTVILETVFGIPGIGSAVIDTVIRRDYPVVQSLSMLFIFIIMLANLFVDISYGFFDPRIKYG
jgi:peptide/nickel transport system permease protein